MEPNRAEFIFGEPMPARRAVGKRNPAHRTRSPQMIKTATAAAFASLVLLAPSVSDAKGCIKGALVGGVAGHYAGHHGLLGAAAGCLVGRHQAQKQQPPGPVTR
jgi:hypothetical protein